MSSDRVKRVHRYLVFGVALLLVGVLALRHRREIATARLEERARELNQRVKSLEEQRRLLRERCESAVRAATERCAVCSQPLFSRPIIAPKPTRQVLGASLVVAWPGAPGGLFASPPCGGVVTRFVTQTLAPEDLRLEDVDTDLKALAQLERDLEGQYLLPRLLAQHKCGEAAYRPNPAHVRDDEHEAVYAPVPSLACHIDWWDTATGEVVATASLVEDAITARERHLQEAGRFGWLLPSVTGDAGAVPENGEPALDQALARSLEVLLLERRP